jgi:hypothetical protein
MAISQLTTANTFEQWLITTQTLVATANLLTDGNNQTFYANTNLDISGSASSLNVRNSAGINTLYANTANLGNVYISGNVVSTLNVSQNTYLGKELFVSGNAAVTSNITVGGNAYIDGDLNVSGNITLDAIGFDDLIVSGSGSFGNNLSVGVNTTLNVATANIITVVTETVTANLSVGQTITTDNVVANTINVVNETVTGELIANVFTGNANTQIYTVIGQAQADSLAFAIALG